MRKVLFREPIHLNISNRGKLRKAERPRINILSLDQTDLILTPTEVMSSRTEERRVKLNFFLKKQDKKQAFSQYPQFAGSVRPIETGSFRAIHTANSFDTHCGFPLRSVTPIRPFRRGIRSCGKTLSRAIEIGHLIDEGVNKFARLNEEQMPLVHKNLREMVKLQADFGPFNDREQNCQQFYKYKEPSKKQQSSEISKLAGTKIEPFRKYLIREVRMCHSRGSQL